MFRDRYTDFWFDDKSSAKFKVWVTNNHDIQNNLSPSFTDNFNAPSYSQTRYYEGTSISNQDLKISCAAIGITRDEWRAISEWLSPLHIGKLVFDWNPNHYYMVKVNKQPTNTIWALNKIDPVLGEIYIVTFDLYFTTVNDWAALGLSSSIGVNVVYDDTEEIKFGETKISSLERFKNDFYIPMLLTRKEYNSFKKYDANSSIILGGNVTIKLEYSAGTEPSFGIIYTTHGDVYANIRRPESASGNWIIQYYDNENFKQEIPNRDEGIDYIINFCEFNYILKLNYECEIKMELNKSLLISNPGSYDMYPKIYGNINSFKLSQNDKVYYNIISQSHTTHYPVEIDCKSGITTSLGQIINSLKTYSYKKIFSPDCVSESLKINSGKPELVCCRYKSSGQVMRTGSTDQPTPVGSHFVELYIDKSLMYGRDTNFIVNIFKSLQKDLSASYGTDTYGWGDNSRDKDYLAGNFEDYILSLNPFITEYKDDKGNLILRIEFLRNIEYNDDEYYGQDPEEFFDGFAAGSKLYISICNAEILEEEHDTNSKVQFVLQTRDAM